MGISTVLEYVIIYHADIIMHNSKAATANKMDDDGKIRNVESKLDKNN